MKIKTFLLSVISVTGFLLAATPAKAVDIPSFPSCYNPPASVKAGYAEGTHWIPGESSLRTGRDTVYNVNDTQLLQCFCAPDDSGIQTNWWKVSDLSEDQINELKSQGWIYIQNGSDFGLDAAPYMAQNSNINCNPTPAPQPCNGCGQTPQAPTCGATKPSTPTLTSVIRGRTNAKLIWTPSVPVTHYSIVYGTKPGEYIYGALDVGNTTTYTVNDLNPGTTYYFSVSGVNDCMPSDASTQNPGQVLGMAFTGNIVMLSLATISGIAFLVLFIDFFRRVKYSI
jgi:hypothetical protein